MLILRDSGNRKPVNMIFTLALEMPSYLGFLAVVHRSKIFSNEKCFPCHFAILYLKITWLYLKFIVKIKISLC